MKETIEILSLDLAGRTGYSIFSQKSGIKTGILTLTRGSLTGNRNPLPMVRLYRRLSLITDYFKVKKVIFEETFARGDAKYRLDSLQHMVIFWAITNGIAWERISPPSWKKQTVGRGNCTKEDYSEFAINKFGEERFWTDDMCAARLILDYAMQNRPAIRRKKK